MSKHRRGVPGEQRRSGTSYPGPGRSEPAAQEGDRLPLYSDQNWRELLDRLRSQARQAPANAGLFFDRFAQIWQLNREGAWVPRDGATKKFLGDVLRLLEEPNASDLLDSYLQRRDKMLQAIGAKWVDARTSWRFVSGLGLPNPTENGFVWDRNLGVPYLPGSSVKGMVRAWAEYWGAAGAEDIVRIFGPRSPDKLSAGTIIFLDAFPTSWPELEIDIMNPHYQEYYTNPSHPPGDWMQPNPIFFLVVKPSQQFRFPLAKRTADVDDADLDLAKELLKASLEWLGAGAKTAVGYGRFTESPTSSQSASGGRQP